MTISISRGDCSWKCVQDLHVLRSFLSYLFPRSLGPLSNIWLGIAHDLKRVLDSLDTTHDHITTIFAILSVTGAGAVEVAGYLGFKVVEVAVEKSRSEGKTEGRCEVPSELAQFGPKQVRRMCLEIGLRFSEWAIEQKEKDSKERVVYEWLVRQVRNVSKEKLRVSIWTDVEAELRNKLKSIIREDEAVLDKLRK